MMYDDELYMSDDDDDGGVIASSQHNAAVASDAAPAADATASDVMDAEYEFEWITDNPNVIGVYSDTLYYKMRYDETDIVYERTRGEDATAADIAAVAVAADAAAALAATPSLEYQFYTSPAYTAALASIGACTSEWLRLDRGKEVFGRPMRPRKNVGVRVQLRDAFEAALAVHAAWWRAHPYVHVPTSDDDDGDDDDDDDDMMGLSPSSSSSSSSSLPSMTPMQAASNAYFRRVLPGRDGYFDNEQGLMIETGRLIHEAASQHMHGELFPALLVHALQRIRGDLTPPDNIDARTCPPAHVRTCTRAFLRINLTRSKTFDAVVECTTVMTALLLLDSLSMDPDAFDARTGKTDPAFRLRHVRVTQETLRALLVQMEAVFEKRPGWIPVYDAVSPPHTVREQRMLQAEKEAQQARNASPAEVATYMSTFNEIREQRRFARYQQSIPPPFASLGAPVKMMPLESIVTAANTCAYETWHTRNCIAYLFTCITEAELLPMGHDPTDFVCSGRVYYAPYLHPFKAFNPNALVVTQLPYEYDAMGFHAEEGLLFDVGSIQAHQRQHASQQRKHDMQKLLGTNQWSPFLQMLYHPYSERETVADSLMLLFIRMHARALPSHWRTDKIPSISGLLHHIISSSLGNHFWIRHGMDADLEMAHGSNIRVQQVERRLCVEVLRSDELAALMVQRRVNLLDESLLTLIGKAAQAADGIPQSKIDVRTYRSFVGVDQLLIETIRTFLLPHLLPQGPGLLLARLSFDGGALGTAAEPYVPITSYADDATKLSFVEVTLVNALGRSVAQASSLVGPGRASPGKTYAAVMALLSTYAVTQWMTETSYLPPAVFELARNMLMREEYLASERVHTAALARAQLLDPRVTTVPRGMATSDVGSIMARSALRALFGPVLLPRESREIEDVRIADDAISDKLAMWVNHRSHGRHAKTTYIERHEAHCARYLASVTAHSAHVRKEARDAWRVAHPQVAIGDNDELDAMLGIDTSMNDGSASNSTYLEHTVRADGVIVVHPRVLPVPFEYRHPHQYETDPRLLNDAPVSLPPRGIHLRVVRPETVRETSLRIRTKRIDERITQVIELVKLLIKAWPRSRMDDMWSYDTVCALYAPPTDEEAAAAAVSDAISPPSEDDLRALAQSGNAIVRARIAARTKLRASAFATFRQMYAPNAIAAYRTTAIVAMKQATARIEEEENIVLRMEIIFARLNSDDMMLAACMEHADNTTVARMKDVVKSMRASLHFVHSCMRFFDEAAAHRLECIFFDNPVVCIFAEVQRVGADVFPRDTETKAMDAVVAGETESQHRSRMLVSLRVLASVSVELRAITHEQLTRVNSNLAWIRDHTPAYGKPIEYASLQHMDPHSVLFAHIIGRDFEVTRIRHTQEHLFACYQAAKDAAVWADVRKDALAPPRIDVPDAIRFAAASPYRTQAETETHRLAIRAQYTANVPNPFDTSAQQIMRQLHIAQIVRRAHAAAADQAAAAAAAAQPDAAAAAAHA